MGKILQLKWYGWILIGLQFILNIIVSSSTVSNFLKHSPSLASPFIPEYAVYLSYISTFIIVIPATLICVGIILLIFKKRIGWIFTCTFMIWHALSLFRVVGAGPVAIIFGSILLVLFMITVAFLFQKKVRIELEIKPKLFIYLTVIPAFLIIVDLTRVDLSMLLARWFN